MSNATASTSTSTASTSGTSTTSFVSGKKGQPVISSNAKPLNVFSNDGSFLERFRKEGESKGKSKQEEALARKQIMNDRIKNRGKRAAGPESDEQKSKRMKAEEEALTPYQKEVKRLNANQSLKDEGMGIRPTLK